jgi:ArsR family transcriptional regulator
MAIHMIEKEAATFSALAHPLRLRILEKLRNGPCCVCKIIPYVGGEQSNVSHHLAILRNAGIVFSEKRGQEVWYAIADSRIIKLIDLMETCILESLRRSRDIFDSMMKSMQ